MVEAMEIQKGFQKSVVGVIPSDWQIIELGSIADITKLAGFEYSKYFNSYKDGGDIIVLRGTNITRNELNLSDVKTIPRSTSNNLQRSKLFKNDLVFAYVGTIGPIYLVRENDRFHLGPNTSKITLKKSYDPQFIFSYFKSWLIKKEIFEYTSIGAQPSLSMSKIRKFKINLPPTKAEQTAIATALNDADALITQLEKLIAKKRAIKQGAMQYILTGIKRLNGFAEEWIEKPFTNVCNLIHGHQFRTNDFIEGSDGIKVIKIGNVQDGGFDTKECDCISPDRFDEFRAYLITNGDILMSLTGNIGRVVRVKDIREPILQNYRVGKFVPNGVDAAFLAYALSSMQTTKQLEMLSNQTSQANFGKQDFEKVKIKLPRTVDEQKVIAKILIDIDFEIEAIENQVEKYKMLKQGMMQKLLTGKIRLI